MREKIAKGIEPPKAPEGQSFFDRITKQAEKAREVFRSMFDFSGLDAFNAAVEAASKKQQQRAEQIIAATRTNAEKLASALEELDVLRIGGFLYDDTFARAIEQAHKKFGEVIEKPKVFDAGAVGALTAGSTGAASAIAAFERRNVTTTNDIAKESLSELGNQTELLERLLDEATRDPEKLITLGT